MKTLYGLIGLQVFVTTDIEHFNQFLKEHDGNIVDIQCTDKYYHAIYKEMEK